MKQVNKKPLIFYYLVAMGVLLLLNWLLFPSLLRQQISEVDYGTFLTMLEEKKVSQVEVESDVIYFLDNDAEPNIYQTATFNDPELVNRLKDSGCKFGEVKAKEMSPIMSFLMTWVLPIAIFAVIGQLVSRALIKKMGGVGPNAMAFGKSNAKMYVASETGIKF